MSVQIIITVFQFWIMMCEYSIIQEDATNLKFAYIYIYIYVCVCVCVCV